MVTQELEYCTTQHTVGEVFFPPVGGWELLDVGPTKDAFNQPMLLATWFRVK